MLEKLSYIEDSLVLLAVLAMKGIRNQMTLPVYMYMFRYMYEGTYASICKDYIYIHAYVNIFTYTYGHIYAYI
jgi:hypothetical protein